MAAMDFDPSDSSGTDDDLPPTHQSRGIRAARPSGNGRTASISGLPYSRNNDDMETQIHQLEQEAYISILRAFKAQADVITWEKESLMTEIRKELRVTDDEHRILLSRVNSDDLIRRIREWRQVGGGQTRFLSNAQHIHDSAASPTVTASRKKTKTSQSLAPLPVGGQAPVLHSQTVTPPQPTPSTAKRGPTGTRGKKSKLVWSGSVCNYDVLTENFQANVWQCKMKEGTVANLLLNLDVIAGAGPAETPIVDPLIGRKVRTRWPADNSFYDAVITDYNPVEGLHALVYDMNTKDMTWEWVDLKEISPDDIQWEGEDPGISNRANRGGRGGSFRGPKRATGRGGGAQSAGRGRGSLKNYSKKDFPSSQNGIGKKGPDDIEILHTESLVKEVERVFSSSHPDPAEVEKARKALKDHEQSLIDAIGRLADVSDGESEDGDQQFSQEHPMERGGRNRQHQEGQHSSVYLDNMTVDGREGSDKAGIGGVATDYRQGGDDCDDNV